MDENLLPFKDNFYKECNTINFFLKLLKEIQTQIEFFGYTCEKDFKILSTRSENGIKSLDVIKANIKIYKNEPSNLYLIEDDLIKFLYIYYSSIKNLYKDHLKPIKSYITKINSNIETTRKNILNHSISMLKQTLETNNRNDLSKYMKETLELIMIKSFKSLFDFFQLILINSKNRNNLFQSIKAKTEDNLKKEEINIVINEMSERNYAKKNKINYEPLHFGNNAYKELLSDETGNIMELSKSYLNYTLVFLRCIQIRKKLIKELKIFFNVTQKKEEEQISRYKKICGKITILTKSLTYCSQGIINSWNLIFSSWNSIYTNFANSMQFEIEIFNPKLIKIIDECNEEYKTFEKRWEKYSSKIKELQNDYIKYSKSDDNEENISFKKIAEEKLKNYLSIDCTDFLDNNVPILRENEIKRANDIRDLSEKIKSNAANQLEQYLENSEKEFDNAASIELFEEIENIFENQIEICEIKNPENFLEKVRENIEKIDFDDKLADNARLSLAEYYEHNNFDEEFDISNTVTEKTENPFGNAITIKNEINDDEIMSFNEAKNLDKLSIGKMKEEEISSIAQNEKNLDIINLNNLNIINEKTPAFHIEKNAEDKNFEENDLNSDIRIINNLYNKFNEKNNKKINKLANIDINEELESDESETNNKKPNLNIINENEKIKENLENNNINTNNTIKNDIIDNKPKIQSNNNKIENKKIETNVKVQDKQTLYFGILGILGLFCLKSLFSTKNIFSADSFLNVIILGIISFVFYKTQFQ